MMEAEQTPRRFIRMKEVLQITGLSRAGIHVMEKQEKFPRKIKIGQRIVVWLEHEVNEWVQRRKAERKKAMPQKPAQPVIAPQPVLPSKPAHDHSAAVKVAEQVLQAGSISNQGILMLARAVVRMDGYIRLRLSKG